jgi:hypothetical protein
MFCPACASQNEVEQGYCRQCGQALSGVRLALEGNAEESLEKLKAGEKWIKGGNATLLAFSLIAVAIAALGIVAHDLSFGYIAFLNLLLGSCIGVPLVYCGRVKLKGAVRLLSSSQNETTSATLVQARQTDELLTTQLKSVVPRLPARPSVTEHTTLDLQKPHRTIK